jgi:hypothetical protein
MTLMLAGQKFGRLTAQYICGKRKTSLVWQCQCECGRTHKVKSSDLTGGKVKSCGCLNRDKTRFIKKENHAKAVAMRAAGASIVKIGRELGVSRQRVDQILKRHREKRGA